MGQKKGGRRRSEGTMNEQEIVSRPGVANNERGAERVHPRALPPCRRCCPSMWRGDGKPNASPFCSRLHRLLPPSPVVAAESYTGCAEQGESGGFGGGSGRGISLNIVQHHQSVARNRYADFVKDDSGETEEIVK